MINPNIEKRVLVEVLPNSNTALLEGVELDIYYPTEEKPRKKPGKRYLYLKYSILNDRFYLRADS